MICAFLAVSFDTAQVALNRAFNSRIDFSTPFSSREPGSGLSTRSVNLSLTKAVKLLTTSFSHLLAMSLCDAETKTRTRGKRMFVAIRIMMLIAIAYAGSAVAGMQFAPLPSAAVSSQP
ncbi:hypothetical protein [Bradyrhizobium macuxiense]|uniref:hypothetical protein n=1 Tax=Bradyrhizobium macuxiense TaxID=1755647 RepID=UPI000AC5E422|nr:hypothetical protein [Bradyrhizobium macuxiense]